MSLNEPGFRRLPHRRNAEWSERKRAMDYLDRMLDHEHWAMAKVFDASAGLSDEQLDQPFDLGLGSIRATFDHLVGNLEGYLREFEGSEHVQASEEPSLADLRERYERTLPPFAELVRQLAR